MAREGREIISIHGLVGLVLLACAVLVGGYHVRTVGEPGLQPYIFVLGVAITATFLFLIVSGLVPALYGSERLAFPITLTLPVVFCVLLVVSSTVWHSTDSSLVAPPYQLDVILLWRNPTVLMLLAVIQFVALTLVGKVRR